MVKSIIVYFIKYYLKRIFLGFSILRSDIQSNKSNCTAKKIGILYCIPISSPRYKTWNDGFVNAIKLLGERYDFTWINIEDTKITEPFLNSFDFLLIKSNWDWGPDKLLREEFKNLKVKKGLAISGVAIPPSLKEMLYYDVLWYETNWYSKIINNHPNIFHGFGINSNALVSKEKNIKYDYITIGAFSPIKRMEKLLTLKGQILVIGELNNSIYCKKIISRLQQKKNIEIKPFVEYSRLSYYFAEARTLYIPATIYGGGERAILEARSCGLKIKICLDNPKLKEIISSPIWDSHYYANQLHKGIESVFDYEKN
jgi:hypothetical protein